MYHHTNPVPRRVHKKTSTGCKACKLRKVKVCDLSLSRFALFYVQILTSIKCDETKPVCKKCRLHFSNIEKCDYAEPVGRAKRKLGVYMDETIPYSASSSQNVMQRRNESAGNSTKLPSSSTTLVGTLKQNQQCGIVQSAKSSIIRQRKSDWRNFQECRCPCHATSGEPVPLHPKFFRL